jgi:adenosylcobinamide-GDP ribazoletransferase
MVRFQREIMDTTGYETMTQTSLSEQKKKYSYLESLRALLQFTTILPIGRLAPFDAFSHRTWLYPFAGYITGGLTGILILCLGTAGMGGMAAAVLSLGCLLFLSGANHLDGLMDFGDGLMAHGSREKRIKALTDRQMGTGACALGMLVILFTVAVLAELNPIMMVVAVLCAEVCAKGAAAVLTAIGKPFHEGLHATLHAKAQTKMLVCAMVLCLPLCLLPISVWIIGMNLLTMMLVPLYMRFFAYRLFGGINGDVVGATHEITRAIIIAVVATVL